MANVQRGFRQCLSEALRRGLIVASSPCPQTRMRGSNQINKATRTLVVEVFILQYDQILSPRRVKCKMCHGVSRGGKVRIIQLGLKILSVFSKYDLIAQTG